jgi:UDP:flavonoid glycosyltransferase YjiC (YdhE family)
LSHYAWNIVSTPISILKSNSNSSLGNTEDKPEVAARAEWCGVGINLRNAQPSAEQVLQAVSEILTNPKYEKRSLELEKEMALYDPMGVVAQNIDDLAGGKS